MDSDFPLHSKIDHSAFMSSSKKVDKPYLYLQLLENMNMK